MWSLVMVTGMYKKIHDMRLRKTPDTNFHADLLRPRRSTTTLVDV